VSASSATRPERYLKGWLVGPGAEHPRHELYEGLDEQTVALDEPFDVGGFPAAYPGDPSLPPEESVGCRCVVVFRQVDEG
jgi:hypothetical protein